MNYQSQIRGIILRKKMFSKEREISIAIRIVIKKGIRINQALIFVFQPDFD